MGMPNAVIITPKEDSVADADWSVVHGANCPRLPSRKEVL